MQYLHVRKIEDYHPGYKDRSLIWCKVYFTMVNADPEFEMIAEIDKWRFVSFIMLELQAKKPIPLETSYLTRKGFDLKKRPIALTIKVLHNFIEVVTRESEARNDPVTQSIVDKSIVYIDKKKRGFTSPSITEVSSYCQERRNSVNPKKFVDFYSAKGWMIGKNKMIDWQAAVRTWEDTSPKPEPKGRPDE